MFDTRSKNDINNPQYILPSFCSCRVHATSTKVTQVMWLLWTSCLMTHASSPPEERTQLCCSGRFCKQVKDQGKGDWTDIQLWTSTWDNNLQLGPKENKEMFEKLLRMIWIVWWYTWESDDTIGRSRTHTNLNWHISEKKNVRNLCFWKTHLITSFMYGC